MNFIYFDQAASSFPKPESVSKAMVEAVSEYAANPGRGGHSLARRASEVIYDARIKLSQFFGESNPNNVIFYSNATSALNQAIQGLPFQKGDHIITTMLEHNSVRRPLELVKRQFDIEVTYVFPNEQGLINERDIVGAIKDVTKAIVLSHGSNVTGAITPIEKIGDHLKGKDIYFVVDASQTAGVLPIHMESMNIDCLAFAGHKSLLGPQGTGVLIIKDSVPLKPLIYGGTGGDSERIDQPEKRPERYESGTLNTPGIAGLLAGLMEIEKIGLEAIFAHEWRLTEHFLKRLSTLKGINYYGPNKEIKRLPVVPFTIEGLDAHEAATIFDDHYKIALRAGIHCSPVAHETIGTIGEGTLRASFGFYNTIEEVDKLVQAIEEVQSYF